MTDGLERQPGFCLINYTVGCLMVGCIGPDETDFSLGLSCSSRLGTRRIAGAWRETRRQRRFGCIRGCRCHGGEARLAPSRHRPHRAGVFDVVPGWQDHITLRVCDLSIQRAQRSSWQSALFWGYRIRPISSGSPITAPPPTNGISQLPIAAEFVLINAIPAGL